MAMKTATETINGKEVTIVLLGALDGIKMTTQLSKVIFPAIAALTGKGKEDNSAADFKELVMNALESLEDVDLATIIKKLFDGSTADDFPIKADDYFAGNYGELVDYLAFALEANFGSFFEAKFLKGQNTPTRKKSK